MEFRAAAETWRGEGLKTAAEVALAGLGRSRLGAAVMERYAFGGAGRVQDTALQTEVAGIMLENPVLFGAGWDKKGRAVKGLYALGFAGGTVGTVLPDPQFGNPKPRLWTIDAGHSVGLNRMGFNSPGMEAVEEYLQRLWPVPFPLGLSVGRNKLTPNEKAVEAHTRVIRRLGAFASYIELAISSPNTPGLRGLQNKGPLRELIQGAREATALPIFAKIDAERSPGELDDMIEVALEEGLTGFVATNTYMGSGLKAEYGPRWGEEAGGLSGADPTYRQLATTVVRYLYEQAGDRLEIIGAGGVDTAEAVLDKLRAGASAVQVVTAVRPSKGRVAATINQGLVTCMAADGTRSIREYIGAATGRGAKHYR